MRERGEEEEERDFAERPAMTLLGICRRELVGVEVVRGRGVSRSVMVVRKLE